MLHLVTVCLTTWYYVTLWYFHLFQVSGLSKWMGDQMTPLQNIPPWAIAIILCLLIATFTECTSNVATATLFLPVLASMVRVFT